ncbi:MAG: PSD1 and planctomycete cytochrome C domain-containing protein [Pirellula sp.]
MITSTLRFAIALVWVAQLSYAFEDDPTNLSPDAVQFFETKIRPVLAEKCYRCHSSDGQGIRGGLSVDNRDALLAGGESGPAIVPGNLEESILWNAINHRDYRMPPKSKLPDSVIEDFRKWIEMGAPDPRVQTGVAIHSKVSAEDISKGKEFWSFRALRDISPRVNKFSSWAKSTIDRYVAQGWDDNDLTPAGDTDATTLLRRIYIDLVGLPPSSEEHDSFVRSFKSSPEIAISNIVDELLERPQFGERWGRHWLDVARYAESTGKEVEMTFPHAWRYRDYVIDSFNADKPYDRFIQEQIAGDLLPAKTDAQWQEHLIATGFLALGPKSLAEQNPRQFQADLIDEQIDTTTRVLLGVSVACARCHDHKFDPIPQSDYYALAGIFQSTTTLYGGNRSQRNRQPSNLIILPIEDNSKTDKPISKSELAELKSQLKEVEAQYEEARRVQRNPALAKDKTPGGRPSFLNVAILDQAIAMLTNKIHSVDSDGNPISMCMGVQDADKVRSARLLVRGEIDQPAQEVERGFVQVLSNQPVKLSNKSSGRLEFAKWIASKDNPLTAKVMVNRIWQHLMGKAMVREPDNFGFSGPAPTHPELLDHLALDFMNNKWSIKHTIRSIVNSRVYRLSSKHDSDRLEADPDNLHIARANVRRLDAESMRDSLLAIGGQIDLNRPRASVIASFGQVTMGPNGPVSIPPAAISMILDKDKAGSAGAAGLRALGGLRNANANPFEVPSYFRSVYLPIARNTLPRALDVFDFAEPSLVVGTRESSNTPDQALYMLNNPFVLEQSDALARRIMKLSSNPIDRAGKAFNLVYGRAATEAELRSASVFFRKADESKGSLPREQQTFKTLSEFCQALFCSAEFRFIN